MSKNTILTIYIFLVSFPQRISLSHVCMSKLSNELRCSSPLLIIFSICIFIKRFVVVFFFIFIYVYQFQYCAISEKNTGVMTSHKMYQRYCWGAILKAMITQNWSSFQSFIIANCVNKAQIIIITKNKIYYCIALIICFLRMNGIHYVLRICIYTV